MILRAVWAGSWRRSGLVGVMGAPALQTASTLYPKRMTYYLVVRSAHNKTMAAQLRLAASLAKRLTDNSSVLKIKKRNKIWVTATVFAYLAPKKHSNNTSFCLPQPKILVIATVFAYLTQKNSSSNSFCLPHPKNLSNSNGSAHKEKIAHVSINPIGTKFSNWGSEFTIDTSAPFLWIDRWTDVWSPNHIFILQVDKDSSSRAPRAAREPVLWLCLGKSFWSSWNSYKVLGRTLF